MPGFADFVEPFCAGWIAHREHGDLDGEDFMRVVVDAYEHSDPRRAEKAVEAMERSGTTFKYAMHSGPHPSLVVDCPTCGAPAGHYCNDDAEGHPRDRPHEERRRNAEMVAEFPDAPDPEPRP